MFRRPDYSTLGFPQVLGIAVLQGLVAAVIFGLIMAATGGDDPLRKAVVFGVLFTAFTVVYALFMRSRARGGGPTGGAR